MSRALTAGPRCMVHHALDISKLLNGCSVTVQIQMSGRRLESVFFHCIGRPILDTSRSPGYYSSTRPTTTPKIAMARLHYTMLRQMGASMLLCYCSNTVPM